MRVDLQRFFREAKRRKLWNVLAVYVALSLGLLTAAEYLFPALEFPPVANRILAILLLFGVPVAALLAWAFDLTAAGIQRTESLDAESTRRPAVARANATVPLGPRPGVRVPANRNQPAALPDLSPETPPDPMRVRRASIAQIKHSLRTPINAMVGYADILLEDGAWDRHPELRAELAQLRAASTQALGRIDVAVKPAEGGDEESFTLSELPADLPADVATVAERARSLAARAAAAGLTESAPDLERIVSAAGQLHSLLQEIAASASGGVTRRIEQASAVARSVLGSIRPLERAQPDLQEGSLLVVDDHAMNRDLLARQLARHGYSVATASSGAEALAKLGTHSFDLILLDVIMPELNGVEVLQRLKADPVWAEIPVLMISALDELDSVVRCIELGADDYLAKPFDPVLLGARIRSNLRVGQVRRLERAYAEELQAVQALNARLFASVAPLPLTNDLAAGKAAVHFAGVATCLHAEVAGVPRAASATTAATVVDQLAALFSAFDASAARLGFSFTQAGPRSYTVLTGADPDENEVAALSALALDLMAQTEQRAREWGEAITIRSGLHTAAAIVGAVPGDHIHVQIAGDAFEVARLLAAHADPGTAHLSPATYLRLQHRVTCEARPATTIGPDLQMRTFVLTRRSTVRDQRSEVTAS
jgi:CheY-like chemotaxis protein